MEQENKQTITQPLLSAPPKDGKDSLALHPTTIAPKRHPRLMNALLTLNGIVLACLFATVVYMLSVGWRTPPNQLSGSDFVFFFYANYYVQALPVFAFFNIILLSYYAIVYRATGIVKFFCVFVCVLSAGALAASIWTLGESAIEFVTSNRPLSQEEAKVLLIDCNVKIVQRGAPGEKVILFLRTETKKFKNYEAYANEADFEALRVTASAVTDKCGPVVFRERG